jgi:hypothetical protein
MDGTMDDAIEGSRIELSEWSISWIIQWRWIIVYPSLASPHKTTIVLKKIEDDEEKMVMDGWLEEREE